MRTRFMNTDCFASSPETLPFLSLPLPHLPPPPCLSGSDDHFLRFVDLLPSPSLEIARLPIDAALSKFICEVTPQLLDVGCGDFGDYRTPDGERFADLRGRSGIRFSETEAEALHKEKEEETRRAFELEALERDNVTALDAKHTQEFEVIQFEEPEIDVSLENACCSEEGVQILSEVLEIESNLNLIGQGLKMPYSEKVQEAIYLVEDVHLEYDMEQKADASEGDGGSLQEPLLFFRDTFHLLEIDETGLGILTKPSMEDEFFSYMATIESQWTQEDSLPIYETELLGFVQNGILELLSSPCTSKQCLESEMASQDTNRNLDTLSIVETLHTKGDSMDCPFAMNPVVFEEFNFLDIDSSQMDEVFFEMQTTGEPETCEWMFREGGNFKSFNELIVSCELALVDDTFKSLPVPVLSDEAKIESMYGYVEQILSNLEPLILSSSNGIYLDWHLLEDDKCNSKIFSCYQNILKELDPYSVDFEGERFDEGKFIVDFVFSFDISNEPKVEEHKEAYIPEGVSSVQLMEGAPRKFSDYGCSKSENRQQLAEEDAGKASVLFRSLSQFNDLDFFLNPGKATAGEEAESVLMRPITNDTVNKEADSYSRPALQENMNDRRLEELLNFAPAADTKAMRSSETEDIKVEACSMPKPDFPTSDEMISEQNQGGTVSCPEIMIVVNTLNFDQEMIVSRRSTYQRILEMEKKGAQVVERDLDLPVDVLISSAICLAWYNSGNIGKKASAVDEASSCLPLCIESIATNVLTLLSFSYSCCILVFEGDTSFLSTVMESSDGLYAAAASLGIDLQLFCSCSSDLTDEIILSSIVHATKVSRGMYPEMPESETLAELFLTKFPSINPLTAHAILCSGGTLIDFFQWSHERRIIAVQQYHVADESVALFSALCRYGEREDSKSIMTDCCSSVSSGSDSGKSNFNVSSERKRQKCVNSPQKIAMHVDDIWQSKSFNQFTHDVPCPGRFKAYDCGKLTDKEVFDVLKWPALSVEDLFGQNLGSDIAQKMDSSTVSKRYNSENTKATLVLDENKNPGLQLNSKMLGQDRGPEVTMKAKLDKNNTGKSENLHEQFTGEVIDLTEMSLLEEKVPSESMNLSCWPPELEVDSMRKSKAARRLSFGRISHPDFPTAAEISSGPDLWTSAKGERRSLREKNIDPSIDDNRDIQPSNHHKKLLEEVLMQRSGGNTKWLPFKQEIPHCSGTPLSKAIHSADPQPGSPWTTEFLNTIRERSRLRQQSLPCDASAQDLEYSGKITEVTKRRSPSILEFFKYQGGSTSGKMHEQKKQKPSTKLSRSCENKRSSTSFLPTWTPIDKRSRKTLSFAMDDGGSQTRLVWTDGNHMGKKLRRQ